uniref:Integrin alpha-2 domain-containing protein n=1 Tax=Myripristis murdjan TaxID=586833 RepID=A0A667WUA6_9TELE
MFGNTLQLSVTALSDVTSFKHLLVGAPKEKAESGVPANQTGGVYSCPITADRSECFRMNLIGSGQSDRDLVEDMWLGVSVASQGQPGGRVLACGHRFVKFYGVLQLRHMIGKCYIRGNDLQYDPDDIQWQSPHQVEIMCNTGISAAITQTEVIVGSPGSFEWQGEVLFCSVLLGSVWLCSSLCSVPCYRYSVTQAPHLLSGDAVTIVTGAPKDNKKDGRGSVLLAVMRAADGELELQQTLRGEQTGSYFGNAVAATDLNSDGWNDLLVGAPFFFRRQAEEGGAVYVYMNAGGRLASQPTLTLRGPAGSAFGMALAAAGDLNQDGFQDFAVGAPFHGTGSVMIWTGSAQGISMKPSQVIEGRQVWSGFRMFGYSLSGGLDVDGNRYPDLLVGSLDDTVALLRTRPVIHLNKTLRVTPDIVDPNSSVDFTVAADVTRHKTRLRFHDNRQDVYTGSISLTSRRCKVLRLGLVEPIQDKVEPLVFSLNASLSEKLPKNTRRLQNLDRFPVLSQEPKPIRTQIHIQTDCGADNRCHSNLQMKAQFTDEEQKPFPSIKRLLLEVNVTNQPEAGRPAEEAHRATLNLTIPPTLKYSGGVVPPVLCSVNGQVLLCDLGNPLKRNQKVPEPSLPVRHFFFFFFFDLTHLGLCHAYFSGHVIGESAVRSTSDIGSPLNFTFQVDVIGKPLGHLGSLEVEFDWPWEVANGKWLLYLTEILLDGTSEPRCVPPGNIVNPLNLKVTMATSVTVRVTMATSVCVRVTMATSDCVHGAARCVKFICPLVNMNNSATLRVRARLWESTMTEVDRQAERQTDRQRERQTAQCVLSPPAGQCGFFRRASTRETYEAKTQKAERRSQPSEAERLTGEL